MTSTGIMIRGAIINVLAFSGSNFLFSKLSKESIDKEQKGHDKAIKDMQRAQIEKGPKKIHRFKCSNPTAFPSN